MFPVRELVFTLFTGFLICGRQYAYGDCNGLTTFLNASENGSIDMSMDRYSNRSCTWLITAPIGQRVLIYFTRFHLRTDCYRCDCDSVTITDGSYTWSHRLAKYCGKDLPRPVYSSGRQMLVTFQPSFYTYYYNEYFTLRYSTLFPQPAGCPSIVPGASAGVIYSPNFPWYYPNSSWCHWYIRNPYFQYININFTYIYAYGDCNAYLELLDRYNNLKRVVSLCTTPVPSSVTYSEPIRVSYYPDSTSSSFMAFYQIGDSVPVPETTYAPPPTWYCQSYPGKSIYIQSSGSTSVSSSVGRGERYTVPLYTTCSWQIATTEGYTLELTFDDMSIYSKHSCSGCSCGYVRVIGGSGSSPRFLGTFCDGNIPSVVSSTENYMFIIFYAQIRLDYFKASIHSKETEAHRRQRIAGIVVPIVIGVVLFAIIVVVIKCTKIRRSTGSAGEQGSSQIPLLLEPIESSPDDEEMIDLTEHNNTASGTSETA